MDYGTDSICLEVVQYTYTMRPQSIQDERKEHRLIILETI